jgi:hypothetical protein
METIYRVTDNTNQLYGVEFESFETAAEWIRASVHQITIRHDGFRPVRVKGEI